MINLSLSESRPTFRQNYIEVKAFEMRPLHEITAICLPSVALVEQVQKSLLLSAYFNFVSTTQHVHEVLFG
jgi:hypothetical protein